MQKIKHAIAERCKKKRGYSKNKQTSKLFKKFTNII